MDLGGVGAHEPLFGEKPLDLVRRLLAEFDDVSQSGAPRWWSLEGPAGWGKTRIVQELYRRLAVDRQTEARYWPPSLFPQAPEPENAGLLLCMRKSVVPEPMVPVPEAVPQWFWWGISCATRSGTAVQALAGDLTQFAEHRVGLERRWRQLASPEPRSGPGRPSEQGEVVETAAGEVLGVAASLGDLPVPRFGVLALAERWGLQGRRHRAATTRGGPAPEVPGRGRTGLVDELAPAMERLAAAGLPIVSACNLIGYAGC